MSQSYADGRERLEIHVPKERAGKLPHHDGQRITITLLVGGNTYRAGIRATRDNTYVWICPDLSDQTEKKTNLATVLSQNGFKNNQSVRLIVYDKLVEVRADS